MTNLRRRQPLQRLSKSRLILTSHIRTQSLRLRRMTKLQGRLSQPEPLIQECSGRLPQHMPGHPLQIRPLQRPDEVRASGVVVERLAVLLEHEHGTFTGL